LCMMPCHFTIDTDIGFKCIHMLILAEPKRSVRPVKEHVVQTLARRMIQQPDSAEHCAPWLLNVVDPDCVTGEDFDVSTKLHTSDYEVLGGNNSSAVCCYRVNYVLLCHLFDGLFCTEQVASCNHVP
jgi:hypothetical protein